MDSATVALVRASFKAVDAVDDGPERLTRSFYSILFADYPDARDFFPAAMDVQRDRLVKAIAYCVDKLEDTENLLPFLAQLGRDHRKYGTQDAHYLAVGNSLVKALRNFAGPEMWTDELARAWDEALGVIATTMIDAANHEDSPPVWGGTIVEHREVLRNLAIVRLQLNEPMEYAAGQYVSVQVPSRPRMWRYLSPANPSNPNGEIEFHVRGITSGWVSPSIVGHSRVGDQWLIGSPLGSLGVRNSQGRDMLLIGCGTGISPLRAQVMEMAKRRSNPRVHLVVAGHTPCDLYDLETLWHLSLTNPWLTVSAVVESEENPWWYMGDSTLHVPEHVQPICGQIGKIVAKMGSWADRDVQICGSPSMIQTTKFRLMAGGTPSQNIRHDPLF